MELGKKISIISAAGIIILFLSVLLFNQYEYKNRLNNLEYSSESIIEMKKQNITKHILKHNKYSKTLELALETKNFKYEGLNIYLELDNIENESYIENINDLIDLEYSKEQILIICNELNHEEITDLLDHEKIIDIEKYLNLKYFNSYNLDRYLDYRGENPELSITDIVTAVNIGLDFPYYVNIGKINNPEDLVVLVNKYRKLSSDYVPNNLLPIDEACRSKETLLRKEARDAFNKLCLDMKNKGFNIKASSGYRSYSYQYDLYNRYVNQDGIEKADTYSARPGHSEHQLGLAVDISGESSTIDKFENTNEYRWLKDNAHKYGFIIRYPENKESITGFKFEPWHYRYVGVNIASYIHETSITFDEYYIRFLHD